MTAGATAATDANAVGKPGASTQLVGMVAAAAACKELRPDLDRRKATKLVHDFAIACFFSIMFEQENATDGVLTISDANVTVAVDILFLSSFS